MAEGVPEYRQQGNQVRIGRWEIRASICIPLSVVQAPKKTRNSPVPIPEQTVTCFPRPWHASSHQLPDKPAGNCGLFGNWRDLPANDTACFAGNKAAGNGTKRNGKLACFFARPLREERLKEEDVLLGCFDVINKSTAY